MNILTEIATLVLCIKDGLSIHDIEAYLSTSILPILEVGDLDAAVATLFNKTQHSYTIKDTPFMERLKLLEQKGLERLIAIVNIISSLPLNKEEIMELIITEELLMPTQRKTKIKKENISSLERRTVSINIVLEDLECPTPVV